MTDPIESPEMFWHRLRSHVKFYDARHGSDFILPCIRARDAAVRREAVRELRDAAIRGVAELVRLHPPDHIPEKWSGYVNRERVVDIALRIKAAADRALADSEEP